MSLYNVGLEAGGITLPPQLLAARQRAADAYWGAGMVRRAEKRFYHQGLDKVSVGAQTPGPIGGLFESAMGLILDVAHVLLLMAGLYVLWRALVPG